MSGCLGPSISFPRRFVTRPETCSPFLCRPSQHGLAGCASHGQPATAQTASRTKVAVQPSIEELRREVDETNDVLARVMSTLRGFPDAAAAVSAMLVPDSPHHQPPRTTS
ncbi:MAG: hypothetical protein JNK87_07470 [Bryobacterales bacterium]|nr:hypothetical protein [Bryobacterales bacterium]